MKEDPSKPFTFLMDASMLGYWSAVKMLE